MAWQRVFDRAVCQSLCQSGPANRSLGCIIQQPPRLGTRLRGSMTLREVTRRNLTFQWQTEEGVMQSNSNCLTTQKTSDRVSARKNWLGCSVWSCFDGTNYLSPLNLQSNLGLPVEQIVDFLFFLHYIMNFLHKTRKYNKFSRENKR